MCWPGWAASLAGSWAPSSRPSGGNPSPREPPPLWVCRALVAGRGLALSRSLSSDLGGLLSSPQQSPLGRAEAFGLNRLADPAARELRSPSSGHCAKAHGRRRRSPKKGLALLPKQRARSKLEPPVFGLGARLASGGGGRLSASSNAGNCSHASSPGPFPAEKKPKAGLVGRTRGSAGESARRCPRPRLLIGRHCHRSALGAEFRQ